MEGENCRRGTSNREKDYVGNTIQQPKYLAKNPPMFWNFKNMLQEGKRTFIGV